MIVMFYIFLVLAVLVSVYHIYLFEKSNNEKLIMLTKCFIVPLILLACLFYTRFNFQLYWLLYTALFCGFLGDLLLEIPHKAGFYTGFLSFFVGHVFYFIFLNAMIEEFAIAPLFYILLYGIGILLVLYLGAILRNKLKHGVSYFGSAYFYLMIMEMATLLVILITRSNYFSIIGIVGIIMFFVSDVFLALNKYKVIKSKHYGIIVMGTYALAQILLALSCILM